MPKTGAERLVESLIDADVKHLFTLSGNQILPVYDATIGRDIQLIHTRHEAAAVHMADGWGRLTESPGVVLLTAGPGHCNGLSALYVAQMAESPVVMLSGHSPHAQIGKGAFQEIDQVAAAVPVSKASWLVEDAGHFGREIAEALALAVSGRPGPVHLSLPVDLLEATPSEMSEPAGRRDPDFGEDEKTDEILDLLEGATRPLILAGPAMGRAMRWADVTKLAEATSIPALSMESPRGVNDPWLHMAATCLAEADVVLLLGKKLDFSLRFGQPPFFSETCRFLQVDADGAQLREDARVALRLCGDPSSVTRRLTQKAQGRGWDYGAWRTEVERARETTPSGWTALRGGVGRPIHPLRACEALQPFLNAGAIFVSDGGEFGQWAQAGLEADYRLINGPSGAIGSALPMGLAAKLAHPDRQVFVLLGDGTFGYHALELDTALRYDLPITVVVGNDARWNAEHQLQVQNYGPDRTVGCDLLPTRYDRVAEALGGHGEFVEHAEDLVPALERAAASGLPACVNVAIEGAGAPTFR